MSGALNTERLMWEWQKIQDNNEPFDEDQTKCKYIMKTNLATVLIASTKQKFLQRRISTFVALSVLKSQADTVQFKHTVRWEWFYWYDETWK